MTILPEGWNPIITAPLDGRMLRLFMGGVWNHEVCGRWGAVEFSDAGCYWLTNNGRYTRECAIGWLPYQGERDAER